MAMETKHPQAAWQVVGCSLGEDSLAGANGAGCGLAGAGCGLASAGSAGCGMAGTRRAGLGVAGLASTEPDDTKTSR